MIVKNKITGRDVSHVYLALMKGVITKDEFDKRVNSSDVFVKGSLKALSYRLRSVEKKM